jgi:hypothetical protein
MMAILSPNMHRGEIILDLSIPWDEYYLITGNDVNAK